MNSSREGASSAEVQIIFKVVNRIAAKFTFGYYDEDDIFQEGCVAALKALDRYDGVRPLENFLAVHVRNRLINLVRDKLRRSDAPCEKCHRGEPCEPDGYCERYASWSMRNARKASLMQPEYITCESHIPLSQPSHNIELDEILEKIDLNLPVELRITYLQMRDGVSVPRAKRLQVEEAIRGILRCNPENVDD